MGRIFNNIKFNIIFFLSETLPTNNIKKYLYHVKKNKDNSFYPFAELSNCTSTIRN